MRCLPLATLGLAGAALLTAAPARAELAEFQTCTQLVDYARATVNQPSFPEYVNSFNGRLDARLPHPDPNPPEPAPGGALQDAYDEGDDVVVSDDTSSGASDTSGTNVHEGGVDEPDTVKTDGRHLFIFSGDELRVYDARRDVPELVGTRPLLLANGTLLRYGDKLIALGLKPRIDKHGKTRPLIDDATGLEYDTPYVTRIVELDIADPAQPRVLRTLDLPGRRVTARQVGSTARIVIDYEPELGLYRFAAGSKQRKKKIGLRDVIPHSTLKSSITGARYSRPLADCDEVGRPPQFAGLELLTVLTIDLQRGLVAPGRHGVIASPQVVYASASTLYVGAARSLGYDPTADTLPERTFTDIYAFDTTEPGVTTYRGSGQVLGLPLSQYAFSEWNGDLRVATTTTPWFEEDDEDEQTDNRITVLRSSSTGGLTPVGLLAGLGKGESIKAVRFFGDRGYLVTFRETDPLFILDLSEPARPAVLGELKIPGYSAYLHPLGDDLILGIGQDADSRGNEKGAQASLFDVSDPRRPRRIAARNLGHGATRTDYDAHAFLWWPQRKLAFVPYEDWDEDSALVALVARRAEPNLMEAARISHGPKWDHPSVERAVVMGPRLLTISELGVGSSRLDDLAPIAFVPFLYDPKVPPMTTPGTRFPAKPVDIPSQ